MSGKVPRNTLLAAGGSFSLTESFGSISPLPVVVGSSSVEEGAFIGQGYTAQLGLSSAVSFFRSSTPAADDPFSKIGQTDPLAKGADSVDLAPPTSPTTSPPYHFATPIPRPLVPSGVPVPLLPPGPGGSLAPPTPQLFGPPQGATGAPLTTPSLKRPVYAPDPFIGAAAKPSLVHTPYTGLRSSMSAMNLHPTPTMPTSYSTPNLQGMLGDNGFTPQSSSHSPYAPPTAGYTQAGWSPQGAGQQDVTVHWFYKPKQEVELWKPFGVEDSCRIEDNYQQGESGAIPVCGTRYDVLLQERVKRPVYWQGDQVTIRRCSWFHKLSLEGRWVPYEEDIAQQLEQEYQSALASGAWQRKLMLENGDWVMMHSQEVMMHFPTSSANHGALDDWGQVQPSSDPALKPRIVHRGLDGLPDIPDSECETVDHLCFVVHGIGAACDIQFRSIFEVVDGYREMTEGISAKHFAGARLGGQANRVEFLPVNWHTKLHGEEKGTDSRLKPLTLRSIPKLRSFVNDTLLDVLFYTSPVYCQTILDTVCNEINKVYKLYADRNPGFQGEVSLIGHSLGSLILFDLLSGQTRGENTPGSQGNDVTTEEGGTVVLTESPKAPVKPRWDKDLSLEEVFIKLGIAEHANLFSGQGISMDELASCSEDDLKEAELPLGPRKKLVKYLEERTLATTGFQEFQNSTVTSRVDYTVGPAGTGQPFVKYPRLNIQPRAFFAFGSPIGMFMAVRGIQTLGNDFKLPTCDRFFNIFHPYDPVAYRIESLVNEDYTDLRPVLIPHHKGRKRMHLELKETMTRVGTDIKQKLLDSLKAVYSLAGTWTGTAIVEEETEERDNISPTQELENNLAIPAQINSGRRIDYVLQEAPMESFNEYLWSLASHLCYWQSEDTSLLVLKEIYSIRNVLPDDQLGGATVQPAQYNLGLHKTVSMPSNFGERTLPPPVSSPPLPTYPSALTLPTYPSPQSTSTPTVSYAQTSSYGNIGLSTTIFTPASISSAGYIPPPLSKLSYTPAPLSSAAYTPAPISSAAYTPAPISSAAYTPAPLSSAAYTPAPLSSGAYTPAPPSSGAYTPAPLSSGAYTPAPLSSAAYTRAPLSSATYTPLPLSSGAFTPIPNSSAGPGPVSLSESLTPAPLSSASLSSTALTFTSTPFSSGLFLPAPSSNTNLSTSALSGGMFYTPAPFSSTSFPPASLHHSTSFTPDTLGNLSFSSPNQTSEILQAPPTFFSPSSVVTPVPSRPAYPKPAAGLVSGFTGMDPTAPMGSDRPIGPPPKMGMNPTAPPSAGSKPAPPPPTTGFAR